MKPLQQLTDKDKIIGFLRNHPGWWCGYCIGTSLRIPSTEYAIRLLQSLSRAKALYERTSTECRSCGMIRKCIRLL